MTKDHHPACLISLYTTGCSKKLCCLNLTKSGSVGYPLQHNTLSLKCFFQLPRVVLLASCITYWQTWHQRPPMTCVSTIGMDGITAASSTRRFTINGTSLLFFFRNDTYFNTCMAQLILYTHLNSRGHGVNVTRERRPQVSVTCTTMLYVLSAHPRRATAPCSLLLH